MVKGPFPARLRGGGITDGATRTGVALRVRSVESMATETNETLPGSVLVVWNDVAAAAEREYNVWYQAEHLPERVAVPGFLTGRRYVAESPGPRYFTYYDLTSIEVLRSPLYLARLENPTDWTRRMMPQFRDMHNTGCYVRAAAGNGMAGAAVLIPLAPTRTPYDALVAAARDDVFPALLEEPGMVRAQLWQGDAEISRTDTAESAMRHDEDRSAGWLLFLESTGRAVLDRALPRLTESRLPTAARLGTPVHYRLLHALP